MNSKAFNQIQFNLVKNSQISESYFFLLILLIIQKVKANNMEVGRYQFKLNQILGYFSV